MSIFLGFYLGHDSNIAVSIDGLIKYRKSERYFGVKHHKAKFDFVTSTLKDWGLSLKDIDYCAYSDGNRNNLGTCQPDELFCKGQLLKSFCLDHHYAHMLSLWPIVDSDRLNFGISIDGRGDHYKSVKVVSNLTNNPTVLHEESFPHMGWDFFKLGKLLKFEGLEYDLAGKLMGLQAYSEDDIVNFGLPKFKQLDISDIEPTKKGIVCETYNAWHEYWWSRIVEIFERFCGINDFIGYSGGCAQNTVFNYRLKKIFPNLYIPPHAYDGGISLGCLEFLRRFFGEKDFSKDGFPYWQDDEIKEKPTQETIKKAAQMLADDKIIGWAQGQGELGPRALGNRSILMNVTKAENKDLLNKKVKKREPWRPYAGAILQKFASDYVDFNVSQYMLYACNVINDKIPAVTHVDSTCRVQTVSEEDNPVFHQLISEYYNLTGLPIILNTSLNTMGSPISSCKNQIINNIGLDAIFLGNKIYRNKTML